MSTTATNSTLDTALAQLETALLTPIVSGELPQWCAAARAASDALDEPLREAVASRHPQMFKEILREDPELATEVEKMQAADEQLLADQRHLQTLLGRLCCAAEVWEPDEGRGENVVELATSAGLALVTAVRRQETALTTWLIEALERDRGVGD